MATWSGKILADDRLLFEKSPGEVLADMARARWPRDTVKRVAVAWGLSAPTAVHVVKGEGSGTVLGKAVRAEGWAFLDEFGERLTGQSYLDWKEQKMTAVIEEAERVQSNVTRLLERRQQLDQQTADLQRALDSERTAERRAR